MTNTTRGARMVYVIDCERMQDKQSVHDELAHALKLPSYYGRNLDALWDCMWELGNCEIVLKAAGELETPNTALGTYGEQLLEVFEDAEREVPGIRLRRIERY